MSDKQHEPEFGWATWWHGTCDKTVRSECAHFWMGENTCTGRTPDDDVTFRPSLCGRSAGEAYIEEGLDWHYTEPKCPECLAAAERLKAALGVTDGESTK